MKKILISGFEPFGGESVNPALEAVRVLEGRIIAGAKVVTRALPVVGDRCIDGVISAVKEVDPAVVIAVGQAGGRVDINPERVAINIDDYRIQDNAGRQPVDEPVVPGGPVAYWSTLPIKAMVARMREAGIPASVSNTAGTFVCNTLFYGLMHYLAAEGNVRRGGFIHIPYLPEQAARNTGQPSLSLEVIVRGLELASEAALLYTTDIKAGEGRTH